MPEAVDKHKEMISSKCIRPDAYTKPEKLRQVFQDLCICYTDHIWEKWWHAGAWNLTSVMV